MSLPGNCKKIITKNYGLSMLVRRYEITINENYLNDPFFVTAILSHELCHVFYTERLFYGTNSDGILDEEHTVDLLVVMLKLGEFQLRVLRTSRIKLGYYNQELFERLHVLVSNKLAD